METPWRLDVDGHLAQLRKQGELVAVAADRSDPDAPVPTCPGWTVREAVQHLGRVHRRVAIVIEQRRPDHRSIAADELGPMPPDSELGDWYRASVLQVNAAIAALSPEDRDLVTFGPAPSPRHFWARRQAVEAAIHRYDIESASGIQPASLQPDFAVDGIEEVWDVFLDWFTELRADPGRTLHLHATDTSGEWLVEIGPAAITVQREHGRGDCAVRGTASELLTLAWNRRGPEGLQVFGDPAVLELWRTTARI